MMDTEIYRLTLETLGVIATVGGVVFGIWIAFRKKPAFIIHDVHVSTHTMTRTGAMRNTGPAREVSHSLVVKIENLRNTKMQVFGVDIDGDHSKNKIEVHLTGLGFEEPNKFIPENSIYEIEYKIDTTSVEGTYSNAKEILVTVRTSFGDKKLSFPLEGRQQLFEALEHPWDLPSRTNFEQRRAA